MSITDRTTRTIRKIERFTQQQAIDVLKRCSTYTVVQDEVHRELYLGRQAGCRYSKIQQHLIGLRSTIVDFVEAKQLKSGIRNADTVQN